MSEQIPGSKPARSELRAKLINDLALLVLLCRIRGQTSMPTDVPATVRSETTASEVDATCRS